MENSELKPCPFCGGKAQIKIYEADEKPFEYYSRRYAVQCEWTGEEQGCGAEGQHSKVESIAIEAWNNRYAERSQFLPLDEETGEK